MHIRIAGENHRILILLTYFTYLLTYFNYFRPSSSMARTKGRALARAEKSSTGTALEICRAERLLEVHEEHIEWLLILACLVHS